MTAAILSNPIPVSTEGFGNGDMSPLSFLLYCIKTRFHISTNLSPSSPGEPGGVPSI